MLDLSIKYLIGGVCLFLVWLGLISGLQPKQEEDTKMSMKVGQRVPGGKKNEDHFSRIRKAFYHSFGKHKDDRKSKKDEHPLHVEHDKSKFYVSNSTHDMNRAGFIESGEDLKGRKISTGKFEEDKTMGIEEVEKGQPFKEISNPRRLNEVIEQQLKAKGLKSFGEETKEQFLKRVKEENGNERED